MPDFPCKICHTMLQAEPEQVGQLVRCPTCMTAMRVPSDDVPVANVATVKSGSRTLEKLAPPPPPMRQEGGWTAPGRTLGQSSKSSSKRYGFNCVYCSSRLEATEASAGQDGQCPTCGNSITIPILDRYGRLIDPKTREVIKQNPHPVHAYAAAGERAPRILRSGDGEQIILCAKCGSASPITANNCKACGMPFTMEGTTVEPSSTGQSLATASLVMGIIGIPASCTVIPALLAIVFGTIAYFQITKAGDTTPTGSGKGLAIAGIACGVVGCGIALMWYFR